MERVKVKQNYRSAALATELEIAMMKHGTGSFVSTHEVVGVLDEEFRELKDEVHANDTDAVRRELLDIAVAAVFGVACIDALSME